MGSTVWARGEREPQPEEGGFNRLDRVDLLLPTADEGLNGAVKIPDERIGHGDSPCKPRSLPAQEQSCNSLGRTIARLVGVHVLQSSLVVLVALPHAQVLRISHEVVEGTGIGILE